MGGPRVAPDRLAYFSLSLRVWSLPFVDRGLRLALDTHDGPLARKIGRTVPGAPRPHESHDALAPWASYGGRDQHGGEVSAERTLARLRAPVK